MSYDLLLAGGEVIDVGGGHTGRADVAVRGGRVAAIGVGLPRAYAREVIDVSGKLVVPGLIDLHTHVHPGATYWGVAPDPIAWYTGVTTWVDAGSAGASTGTHGSTGPSAMLMPIDDSDRSPSEVEVVTSSVCPGRRLLRSRVKTADPSSRWLSVLANVPRVGWRERGSRQALPIGR